MLRHELSPDEPSIYVPCAIFIGRGTTQDGIHYEGFMMNDNMIHYFNTQTGEELNDCDITD